MTESAAKLRLGRSPADDAPQAGPRRVDPVGSHLDHVAQEWSDGVDHGATWPSKIVSAKLHAVEACWKIADLAMEVCRGAPASSRHRN